MRPLRLHGRVVVITGGAGGIGRETAIAFAGAGARVAVADIDGVAARATAELIGDGHGAYATDVRDEHSFGALLAAVQGELGPPLVLVNNAGVMPLGALLDQDDEAVRRAIDVNLWGTLVGTRLALRGMLERGEGHVVNVASMMGRMHAPGAAPYCAAKHGVVGFGGAVRGELEGTGVSLTTVLPSAVRTPLITGLALGSFPPVVEPYEVAAAIVASTRHRRGEVSVPRWLGRVPEIERLFPVRLTAALRRRVGGDAALSGVDAAAREAYERSILDAELVA